MKQPSHWLRIALVLLIILVVFVDESDARRKKKKRKKNKRKRKPKRPAQKAPNSQIADLIALDAQTTAITTTPSAEVVTTPLFRGVDHYLGENEAEYVSEEENFLNFTNSGDKYDLRNRVLFGSGNNLRHFLTCEVSLDETRKVYPIFEENTVFKECDIDTIRQISFWKKPLTGEYRDERLVVNYNFEKSLYLGLRICRVDTNPMLVTFATRNCARGYTQDGMVYGMNGKSLARVPLLNPLKNVADEKRFFKISIFVRQSMPKDVMMMIEDENRERAIFDLTTFRELIPEFYVAYAGEAMANNLKWPKDPRMVKKYDGRPTSAFFAHGQEKSEDNLKPTYEFSSSKFPGDNHQPLHHISHSDITSFRLLSTKRATDSELTKLTFCANKQATKFQILLGQNTCTNSMEKQVFSGYAFNGMNDALPANAFPAFIYNRKQAPFDSKISDTEFLTKLEMEDINGGMDFGSEDYLENWELTAKIYLLPAFKPIELDRNLMTSQTEVRSTSMLLSWSPMNNVAGYFIDVYPYPKNWQGQVQNDGAAGASILLAQLDPNTDYSIRVLPFVKRRNKIRPINTQMFIIRQKTSPLPPNIIISSIQSTKISLKWDIQEEIKHYILDVAEKSSVSRTSGNDQEVEGTTIKTKPNTNYEIMLTGVLDTVKNIKTDMAVLQVLTSPSPPDLKFQAIDRKKVEIGFTGVPGFDEYHFRIHPPLTGVLSGVFNSSQVYIVEPVRNTKYEMSVIAKNSRDPKRATDRLYLDRVYSFCQWTQKDLNKLNCKPKKSGLEHTDGFSWMMNDKNGLFQTYENSINLTQVKILHLQNNLINDFSLVSDLVDAGLNNVWNFNLQNNLISEIPESAFEGLLALAKLDLSGNQIKKVESDSFRNVGKELFKINLANNPLHVCGVSQDSLKFVKEQLTVLDLHGTGVKQAVRGVLNAADLGNVEGIEGDQVKYDQMCRVTV